MYTLLKNLIKSIQKNCGHPGEGFSRHPHLQKQEYYFFWPYVQDVTQLFLIT